MNRINYQKKSDEIIQQLKAKAQVPTLLLHSCCAPCSSYVLEYLSRYFRITVFYYNPNIAPEQEYVKRQAEIERLIAQMPSPYPVSFLPASYERQRFLEIAEGLEQEPEGGTRCLLCYRMRMEETARMAKANGFDYFTTTLSISPLKNAEKLNEIGSILEHRYGVAYFYSDFKKREGYKRSIQLSKEYHLYRQNYCGCVYSKAEAARREGRQ